MITKQTLNQLRRDAYCIQKNKSKNTILVKTDKYEASLDMAQALDADPYFLDPETKWASTFKGITDADCNEPCSRTISKTSFIDKNALFQVAQCAGTDETRPVLTLVKFEENEIVATDSYKLRSAITSHGFTGQYNAQALLFAVKATTSKKDTSVEIRRYGQDLMFFSDTGDCKIFIRHNDHGGYPNWRMLIPGEPGQAVVLPTLKQIANPYGSRSEVCVLFVEGKGYLFSSAGYSAKRIGMLDKQFPKTLDRYVLNYGYLQDAIAGMKNVLISFSEQTKPIMFLDATNKGCSIIMPIRCSEMEPMVDSVRGWDGTNG